MAPEAVTDPKEMWAPMAPQGSAATQAHAVLREKRVYSDPSDPSEIRETVVSLVTQDHLERGDHSDHPDPLDSKDLSAPPETRASLVSAVLPESEVREAPAVLRVRWDLPELSDNPDLPEIPEHPETEESPVLWA